MIASFLVSLLLYCYFCFVCFNAHSQVFILFFFLLRLRHTFPPKLKGNTLCPLFFFYTPLLLYLLPLWIPVYSISTSNVVPFFFFDRFFNSIK